MAAVAMALPDFFEGIKSLLSETKILILDKVAVQALQAKDDEDTTTFNCQDITLLPSINHLSGVEIGSESSKTESRAAIYERECKLFLFDKLTLSWEQKAAGPCRILRVQSDGDDTTGCAEDVGQCGNTSSSPHQSTPHFRNRIIMRQMRTHQVALNLWLEKQAVIIKPHESSKRSLVLSVPTLDIADDGGDLEASVYCLRFPIEKDVVDFLEIVNSDCG